MRFARRADRRLRRRLLAVALLVTLTGLAGCARDIEVARPAEPGDVPAPYAGPLYVGPDNARNDAERETGAAGRVVACTTRVGGDFRPEDREAGRTPKEGLGFWFSHAGFGVPAKDFLLERQEGDRALFTFRVGGQAKMAAIMLNGTVRGSAGWYVESWAYCDPSEFPKAAGIQAWTDAKGQPVPTFQVSSRPGPEHCDWERMTFLTLDENWDQAYVQRVPDDYVGTWVTEPYRSAVRRPNDAVDTGYRQDGRELWLSADRNRAYVGTPGARRVELWPRTTQPLRCA